MTTSRGQCREQFPPSYNHHMACQTNNRQLYFPANYGYQQQAGHITNRHQPVTLQAPSQHGPITLYNPPPHRTYYYRQPLNNPYSSSSRSMYTAAARHSTGPCMYTNQVGPPVTPSTGPYMYTNQVGPPVTPSTGPYMYTNQVGPPVTPSTGPYMYTNQVGPPVTPSTGPYMYTNQVGPPVTPSTGPYMYTNQVGPYLRHSTGSYTYTKPSARHSTGPYMYTAGPYALAGPPVGGPSTGPYMCAHVVPNTICRYENCTFLNQQLTTACVNEVTDCDIVTPSTIRGSIGSVDELDIPPCSPQTPKPLCITELPEDALDDSKDVIDKDQLPFANFENGESDDGSVDVPFTDRDINYILNKVALPSTLLKAGTTISLRKFSSYITDNEDDEKPDELPDEVVTIPDHEPVILPIILPDEPVLLPDIPDKPVVIPDEPVLLPDKPVLVVESSCDVNESSGYHTLPCPSPTSLPVMPSSIEEEEEEETLVVSIPTEIWLKARDNKRRESSKVEIHSTLEELLDQSHLLSTEDKHVIKSFFIGDISCLRKSSFKFALNLCDNSRQISCIELDVINMKWRGFQQDLFSSELFHFDNSNYH